MRNELNLSQTDLAKLIGVTSVCISRWKTAVRIPNAPSIIVLCKALNYSADYLLGISDD